MTLSDILEDQFDNAGSTVASILASAGDDRITDADAGALEGIAVIGVDNTHGLWQYDANADWKLAGLWSGDRSFRSAPRFEFLDTLCAHR